MPNPDPNRIIDLAISRDTYLASINSIALTIDGIIADAKETDATIYQEISAQQIYALAKIQIQKYDSDPSYLRSEVSICLNSVLAYLFGIGEKQIAEHLIELLSNNPSLR